MKILRSNLHNETSESPLKMSRRLVRYTNLQLDQMYEVYKRTQKKNAVDILGLNRSTGLTDLQIRVNQLVMKIVIRYTSHLLIVIIQNFLQRWFSYTKRKLKQKTDQVGSKSVINRKATLFPFVPDVSEAEEHLSTIEYQTDTGIQVNCPLDVTSYYLKNFPVHCYLGLSFPSRQFHKNHIRLLLA